MRTTKDATQSVEGARHEGLLGGTGKTLRFRPERLMFGGSAAEITCRFQYDDQKVGPVQVLDVSSAGIGLSSCPEPLPAPGSTLKLELLIGSQAVWNGEAVVMHVVDTPPARIGARFTSGLLDLRQLHLRNRHIEGGLHPNIQTLQRQRDQLPASWRADVADLRMLLDHVKDELDELLGDLGKVGRRLPLRAPGPAQRQQGHSR